MISSSKLFKRTDNEINMTTQCAFSTDRPCDDDSSTLRDEEQETAPSPPGLDKNTLCSKDSEADSHDADTIFEAWEVISVRPTIELTTFKSILGVRVISTYKALKDGYTGVRAMPSYSQTELRHIVTTAENHWRGRYCGLGGFMKSGTYSQDLARRIFELPGCLPSKLGALLDCRYVSTNRNPHVRREWKIVMLEPVANVMTDGGQQSYRPGLRDGGCKKQGHPVQKWLVVLRGQETRVSEKAFQAFSTMSNPWLKVDERPHNIAGNVLEQPEVAAGQRVRLAVRGNPVEILD
ncbi:hypothetical protein NPX13_g6004 [Xylaria arbuscula]|uniref:Uncharacterized protein n=1 Tax=Xylaria arbuscula TaxID=114810 RepID=A0A9W8NDB7_9PEZI|nr:hypothetical protein NPX13_g6004 [Xylaria arbuscula]